MPLSNRRGWRTKHAKNPPAHPANRTMLEGSSEVTELRLDDEVAIMTGADRGLGQSRAQLLAAGARELS